MKNNVIPRKFNIIKGRVLIKTSCDKIGDIVHITKNDYGYLGLNQRTGKYGNYFVNMLRDTRLFEIITIE